MKSCMAQKPPLLFHRELKQLIFARIAAWTDFIVLHWPKAGPVGLLQ